MQFSDFNYIDFNSIGFQLWSPLYSLINSLFSFVWNDEAKEEGIQLYLFPKKQCSMGKDLGRQFQVPRYKILSFVITKMSRRKPLWRDKHYHPPALLHQSTCVCKTQRHGKERQTHRHRYEHPQRSEQGVRSPRAGVSGSRETFGRWKLESSRLAGRTQLLSQAHISLLLQQLALFIIQNYSLNLKNHTYIKYL